MFQQYAILEHSFKELQDKHRLTAEAKVECKLYTALTRIFSFMYASHVNNFMLML